MCPRWIILSLFQILTDAVTLQRGGSANLSCNASFGAGWIIWSKKGSTEIICKYYLENNIDKNIKPCGPRVEIVSSAIHIRNLECNDSGEYNCTFTKMVPPPTLHFHQHIQLNVEGLSLRQTGHESSCIQLQCTVCRKRDGVTFSWSRDGQALTEHQWTSHNSSDWRSTLRICHDQWSFGDNFTCYATHSTNESALNTTITITENDSGTGQRMWQIIGFSIFVGIVVIVIFSVAICIWRKRNNESTVYVNKVYENFTFSTQVNTPRITVEQREECIYEN